MAESTEPNKGVVVQSSQPEMVRITLNNEEVEVPNIPQVIEKLKEVDHSLKSGYGKLLENERAQINAEKLKNQKFIEEDIKFLSTHDPEDYEFYAAKIIYGDDGGFKPPANRERKMEMNNVTTEPSADIKAMQQEIKSLKEIVEKQQTMTVEEAKSAAESALTAALKEFKFADEDTVVAKMTTHFFTNKGKHPSPEQVREFARKDHERVAKLQKSSEPTGTHTVVEKKAAMPQPGKSAPETTPEKKRIPLWDIDAQIADLHEFRKNQPGG